MRKISKTRLPNQQQPASGAELGDTQPGRIRGATISAWTGSLDINLEVFLARECPAPSIAGAAALPQVAAAPRVNRSDNRTVSLSDGTRITFATADQFDNIGSV